MSQKDRSSAGTSSKSSKTVIGGRVMVPGNKFGIIFEFHRGKFRVDEYSDQVSDRIAKLDVHAQHLGETFGMPFTSFVLTPTSEVPAADGAAMLAATIRALTAREERVTLERRSGRWGLYFVRTAAALAQDRGADPVSLKDAPLDVRERFLSRSDEFFRGYLELVEKRRDRMQQAVAAADRTLELLGELPPKA